MEKAVAGTIPINLPHGDGFRLLSRVTKVDSLMAKSEYDFRGDEILDISAHFPGNVLFPAALLLEVMAQGAIQCLQNLDNVPGMTVRDFDFRFRGAKHFKVIDAVYPGSTIKIYAKLDDIPKITSNGKTMYGEVNCRAKVNDKLVSLATILYAMVEKSTT